MSAASRAERVIGTRGSALALWQARHVESALARLGVPARLETFVTQGDRVLDVPLAEIGDKGLFTRELDLALADGRIHLAVHSLKDLPTQLPDVLRIAAVTAREEPWDAFVAGPGFEGGLAELPDGATLATSSLRRQAQLTAWRPDLRVVPVRGNVDTRLRKLDESGWEGMILAAAGLIRLGAARRIRARVPAGIMLPAVGQGALGVVCRADDEETAALLREALDHPPTARATAAERAFLRRLEGGCQVPIGAWGRVDADGRLRLDGCIASLDGSRLVRGGMEAAPADAETLGRSLAEHLLGQGGEAILREIRGL